MNVCMYVYMYVGVSLLLCVCVCVCAPALIISCGYRGVVTDVQRFSLDSVSALLYSTLNLTISTL